MVDQESFETGLSGALADLKVIEYSLGAAGAMCAKAMADLGADVVKVEPPEGDPTRRIGPFPGGAPNPEASGQFLYLNANKRGVTLDLRSEAGRKQLFDLVARADVFVCDLSPKRAAELRLSPTRLERVNPRLICTYVTPFGNTGPYRDYEGTDLIVWHTGGMGWETPAMAVTDMENQPPLRGRGNQAEYLAGWVAATATMAALHYRETYGVGQEVDVSAMEAVANHIRGNFATYSYDIDRLPQTRQKNFFRWIWPCKDGHVSAAFTLDHWWEQLKQLMGRPPWADEPEYAELPGRRDHVDEIEPGVIEWMSDKTRAQLYRILQEAGVPCFPVLSMAEVVDSAHYRARGFFVEQSHPVAGNVTQPGPPMRFSRTPWQLRRPAPTLGQHNIEVLAADDHGDTNAEAEVVSGPRNPPRSERSEAPRNRPLQGVRVVDLGWILSVPHCGAWLGTLGAEVIRVESNARLELGRRGLAAPTDGPPSVNRSAGWNGLNYSKLGVTLNLRDPDAVGLVKELVAVSDVVMENFATGVLERLGLGYEELVKVRPDLVMISGSTLGVTGPERTATGWGPNVVAYAGQPIVTGYQGGEPQNLGGNWPDYLVGTMMAFGVMSALRHRGRTGEGQHIEVAMSELVSSLIPEAFMEFTMNGQQVGRIGNHDPNMAPHNVYRCRGDDAWVAIAVRDDAEWRAVSTAIGRPDLGSDPRYATLVARKRNEDELDRTVSEWTAGRSPGEVTEILQALGVPAGPVMNVVDLMADPHFSQRGFAVEMDHPEVGRRTVAGIPARFGAMPELAYFSAPLLGQHNDSVFGDLLAHSEERIQQLMLAKAIY